MRESEGGNHKEGASVEEGSLKEGSQEVELRWLLTIFCAASRISV